MDFSSIPAYLDPSNWQQPPPPQHQQQHQNNNNHAHGFSINNSNPLLPPPPLPPPLQGPVPPQPGPMGGSIRPGSMAERARIANIPMPEPAQKCPRCESTNTKFCYFNNYSLSQPRHFCKTCRRYWTRGGALRTVPVGGGCRRNKRSKSATSSKSDRSASTAAAATSSASSALSGGVEGLFGLTPPPLSGLRFMSPMSDFGGLGFHSGGDLGLLGGGMDHQWRVPATPPPPQFPFLGALDAAAGYGHPYSGVERSVSTSFGRSKGVDTAPVKMEGRHFNLGMLSNLHGSVVAGEHFNWGGGGSSSSGGGGNAWTDMASGVNNSSCSTTSAL